ncbi:MAG: potassium transporter Kup [Verrucomicrobiota bacterium]
MNANDSSAHSSRLWLLILGALGIVFGDIGTSPLYAMRECFTELHGTGTSQELKVVLDVRENVLGVLSLIIWTITLMITLKYVVLVMRADKQGEGGILALLCVAFPERRGKYRSGTALLMVSLGIFGAALLYGDGIITPAISVLSAVETLNDTPMKPYIVPITIAILVALFSVQRLGTGKVGVAFGPITLLWFLTLALLGVRWILEPRPDGAPSVFAAFNPMLGLKLLMIDSHTSIKVLSGVFLTVTGGEALYADMGHFGRRPISLAWVWLVKPALLLNYLGQGAFLLHHPEAIENPLKNMTPEWGQIPLTVLATLATVIASQALISGVFSLTMQAVQLGYLPRTRIQHTSSQEKGQIYISRVNWALMAGCIALVAGYGSSQRLAAAYGIAVALTMLVTTILLYFAARRQWEWSAPKTLLVIAGLVVLSAVFVFANALKFFHGGWIPVTIGIGLFTVMMTWKEGRRHLGARLAEQALPLDDFLTSIERGTKVARVPGTAVFMSGSSGLTPTALLHNLKHNKVLHERIVFLTIENEKVPYIPAAQRVVLDCIAPGTQDGHGVWRVVGHYGFMEQPDIQEMMRLCGDQGLKLDPMQTSFFLGRETVIPGNRYFAPWRAKLFALLSRNAQSAVAYYNIPPGRVVEFGIQIEL